MGSFLLRAAVTGLALWVVTLIVPGISFVGGDTTLQRAGIILVVAIVFGVVNAIIKPVVQILSIPLYILTLGLISLLINGLLLWITAWFTQWWGWGLSLGSFWLGVVAALVISLINWVFGIILRPQTRRD